MAYSAKKLEHSQLELTITVAPPDYKKYLEPAAQKLSEETAVKGFRRGKVPYDLMKRTAGEMAILQAALAAVVQQTFGQAIKAEGVETIGQPDIQVEKLAPGNEIVYRATVALMPTVKLADWSKIKVKKTVKPVAEKKVDDMLAVIRGRHAIEIIKNGPAEGTDKLILDLALTLNNVPVEGGQTKNHQVYLSEDHYIPGFNEQVRGLKKDEEKKFSLEFPTEHYQPHLAGKKVDFKVKVKEVYARQLPDISDELAQKLGQANAAKLKELIRHNLEEEAKQKAGQTVEIEILNQMIAGSTFAPIPTIIIEAEKQKMFFELKRDLERHGVSLEQYLADIKKTEKEIYHDFQAQAEKRAKAALISRQIARAQNLKVSAEEVAEEIKIIETVYQDNSEYQENLKLPIVRESIATTLQNKKVMTWLTEQILPAEKKSE